MFKISPIVTIFAILCIILTSCDEPVKEISGTVTITGNPWVGSTLTADTSALGGSGKISYQWKRGGGYITGATGSTYTINAAEADFTITVTVSRAGSNGEITSAPTSQVSFFPLTGTVSITGTPQVGHTLTAVINILGGSGDISYQWQRRNGTGESQKIGDNADNYTITSNDIGSSISVYVTRSNNSGEVIGGPVSLISGSVVITGTLLIGETLTADITNLGGDGEATYQWLRGDVPINGETQASYTIQPADEGSTLSVTATRSGSSATSAPTGTVTSIRITGSVSLVGDPWVGETLSVDTSNLDGKTEITYIWRRGNTSIDVTEASYTLQPADIGHRIWVIVSRLGFLGGVQSPQTDPVVNPPLHGSVKLTGNPWVGQTLNAEIIDITGSGTTNYQWRRNGNTIGASGASYTLQTADLGSTITVRVSRSGNSGFIESNPTNTIVLPPMTGTVTITGTPLVGNVLTANTAGFSSSGTFTYQWKRSGTTNIGANSTNYTVTVADVGSTISVTVTHTGYSGSVTSNATDMVPEPDVFTQWVTRVNFTGPTATVNLHNLLNHDIYLVKVNTNTTASVNAAGTGSVANIIPSLMPDIQPSNIMVRNEMPIRGRPHEERAMYPAPGTYPEEALSERQLNFVPPVVGNTRSFYVTTTPNGYTFTSISTSLRATGTHSNIWVHNNSISDPRAQQLAVAFDIIYPRMTNVFGYEYGGRSDQPTGGRDGDPKIQVLVYSIGGGIAGYFWPKDDLPQSQMPSGWRTNFAEIFYLDSNYTANNLNGALSTLVHEFQHMIHYNEKEIARGLNSPAWYNEMLAMVAEDIIAEHIGIPPTSTGHVIQDRMPSFLTSYTIEGVSEWGINNNRDTASLASYETKYAFGAYLLRNYGGADLVRRMMSNNFAGVNSIGAALRELDPSIASTNPAAFTEALRRYGEAMIYSNPVPANLMTFNKNATSTVNSIIYNSYGFNIWTMQRSGSSLTGPIIYPLNQRAMPRGSISLHSDNSWLNRTGTFTVTFNRPSNTEIEFILMARPR